MKGKFFVGTVLAVLAVFGMPAQAAEKIEPYALEEWAKRADMSNVRLSPDGEKLALLRIPTKDGNPILEVYDANDLGARPFIMDAKPMEMTRFYWATDDKIIFTARLQVRNKIDGFNQGVYEATRGVLTLDKDRKKSKWSKISQLSKEGRGGLRGIIPTKPNKFLITEYDKGSRYPKYFEYDVKTGLRKLITWESPKVYGFRFDGEGNPQFGSGYDAQSNEILTYYRKKGSKDWQVINRQHRENFEDWYPVGVDPLSPNDLLVLAHNGENTVGLWSFDPEAGEYKELIYRRSDVDLGVRRHTNSYTNYDQVAAVSYFDGRDRKYEWFDGEEKAIYEQLMGLIPHADRMRIGSRSRDGNSMIVSNEGPRDPGTYYLLKNGELKVIGSEKPQFASERLADAQAITYKARDGRKITGFITIPNGKPPYPLVVMPHGGPFVSKISGYDEWAQLIANHGYMVFEPQYRGSTGYGLDFYQSAFINGGEGGHKMQDDKDDGALYLVDQGLADPDKLAMFGWSYGGYAALIAATREEQIYQCAIAGAAVADNIQQLNYYRGQMARFPSSGSIEQIKMWEESISPIKEVEKVNIPLFVIHGSVDQRVPPEHARKYIKALQKYDIPHKAMWLEDADHFSNTLFYRHKIQFYPALIDFLEKDCFGNEEGVASND
jgi:dipeptidyl aminopeptidase/acylaminoacyl peptidase